MSFPGNTGVVILAAGPSSRLGEPKQLLKHAGKNLLQKTIDAALGAGTKPIVVVLGANAEQITGEINKSGIHLVINPEWKEGMASSVRIGLNELLFINPNMEAVILMVCDQPHVSAELINQLVNEHEQSGKSIVTCNYGEAIGPPALFSKTFFKELMKLKGDVGARKIIQKHSNEVATISFADGKTDIDTKEDYNALTNL